MRFSLLTAGTALLLCQSVAMAQTNTHPKDTTAEPSANATTSAPGSIGSQMRDSLQKAGFSNIRMVPSSFVISATDKDGNPVIMTVTPDSFTEVTEEGHKGSKSAGPGSEDSATASSGSEFVSVANNDELSSKLIGLDIYNSAKQDIGQIKDIAMSQRGRAQAYIVSVGGFLGMGEHYVAVNPSAITVTYSESDKKWHAAMNATAEQLKAAPEFKYTGRWSGSRS